MLTLIGKVRESHFNELHAYLRAILEASDGPHFDRAVARLSRRAMQMRVQVARYAVEDWARSWLDYLAVTPHASGDGTHLFTQPPTSAGTLRLPPGVEADGLPLVIDGWEPGEAFVVSVDGVRMTVDVVVRIADGDGAESER